MAGAGWINWESFYLQIQQSEAIQQMGGLFSLWQLNTQFCYIENFSDKQHKKPGQKSGSYTLLDQAKGNIACI